MICNNNRSDGGSTYALTIGRDYPIVSETRDLYTVVNDNGSEQRYAKSFFDEPTTGRRGRRNTQATANRTAPQPIIETVTYQTRDRGITVNVNNRGNESSHTLEFAMQDTPISCGLYTASGVNTVASRMNAAIAAAPFRNREELRDEITNRLFSSIASSYDTTGGLLLSTNTGAGHFELFDDALEEIATESLGFRNPNSGNEIMTWILNLNTFR